MRISHFLRENVLNVLLATSSSQWLGSEGEHLGLP